MPDRANPLARAWVPALFWLAVIAWESTPFGSAANTEGVILPFLHLITAHLTREQIDLANHLARKIGHCVGYGTLSLFMLRGWWATVGWPRPVRRLPAWSSMARCWSARAAALAMASTVAVAALDEWHQASIPGRTSSWRDVVLDSLAAGFMQLAVIALSARRKEAISN